MKRQIWGYICILSLIFMTTGLATHCSKESVHKPNSEDRVVPSEPSSTPQARPAQQRRAGRRGRGMKAVGRGFARRGRSWGPSEVIELTPEERKAIQIQTTKASLQPLRSQLSAMGKVLAHPLRKAIVSYPFSARVSQIHVGLGEWVKKGELLITLKSEEVGSAKSSFYKARADYELAKINYEREKRLYDRGVGAQKNFLSAEADLKVAEANLNAAEKKLHVLGFSEEQVQTIAETHQINPTISLFAPISGKVTERNATLGAMIDQNTEIATIMNPAIVCVNAEIYEKDISKITEGQNVEVTVPAYPQEKFKGEISYISDVLKEETRTITVRSEVQNKDFKLKPGMFADITIFLNHQRKALVLPQEAILDDKGDPMVFIQSGGKYYPQLVETGVKEEGLVEILNGLAEGDEVVVEGNFQLKSKLYEEILKKSGVH